MEKIKTRSVDVMSENCLNERIKKFGRMNLCPHVKLVARKKGLQATKVVKEVADYLFVTCPMQQK